MQRPTCTSLRVRTPQDAHVIFHAVFLDLLPMVSRRLDIDERRNISTGCVFVWEERGPNAEATGMGIERWTDSIRWGPSRVRDEFLFYHERETARTVDKEFTSDSDAISPTHAKSSNGYHRQSLIKQTYSVFVETNKGRRKWHLIAYFTQETLNYLNTIDDHPQLASLTVPTGMYRTARIHKGRPQNGPDLTIPHIGYHPNPSHPYPPFGYGDQFALDIKSRHAGRPRINIYTMGDVSDILAPLQYLQNIPPPSRHPLDEKALKSLIPDFK